MFASALYLCLSHFSPVLGSRTVWNNMQGRPGQTLHGPEVDMSGWCRLACNFLRATTYKCTRLMMPHTSSNMCWRYTILNAHHSHEYRGENVLVGPLLSTSHSCDVNHMIIETSLVPSPTPSFPSLLSTATESSAWDWERGYIETMCSPFYLLPHS